MVLWGALFMGLSNAGWAETLDTGSDPGEEFQEPKGDDADESRDDVDAGERAHEGSSRRLRAHGSGEYPVLLVEPMLEAQFPHFGGFSLDTNLHASGVNLHARGGVGFGLWPAEQGLNYVVEAYLGYAVASWRGRTTAKRVLDTEQTLGGVTLVYDTVDVPKSQLLVLEAGFDNAGYTFDRLCAQPGCLESTRAKVKSRITTLAAGVRYLYAYDGRVEDDNVRRTWSAYAHVLAFPLAFPSGDVTLPREEKVVKPGPIGVKAGVEFAPYWPYYMMHIGAGYLVAEPVPFFEFGAGVNLWPLF